MARLPDLEGLAIFAKVAECRSFGDAAVELRLSKATVSKAVGRIEERLGARLILRSARRFELTDAGRQLVSRAAKIVADGETAEDITQAQARLPRGVVRLVAPMSFGVFHVAPLLPEFLDTYPEISLDLVLNDAKSDLLGEGHDAAIRIAVRPGLSFAAEKLWEMPRYLVASPRYLEIHGRPKHPLDLARHRCISYSYTIASEVWQLRKGRKTASIRPSGPLRVNNGDAMMPALIGGTGIGLMPEFFLREALQSGSLEKVLPDWSIPLGAVFWVTPLEGPLPKRVEVLRTFLVKKLGQQQNHYTGHSHGSKAAEG
jgi:DNA-binding transcriptional LysR family regulator